MFHSRPAEGRTPLESRRLEERTCFVLMHVAFDYVPAEDFVDTGIFLGHHLGINPEETASMLYWFVHKRHCRHSWLCSDATRKVKAFLETLPTYERKLLFLVCVLCCCNHRNCYERFAYVASRGIDQPWTDIKEAIYNIIVTEGWLADSRKYPVSAATAYGLGIAEYKGKPQQLAHAVVEAACQVLETLECTNLDNDLKDVTELSTLQQAMFARYLTLAVEEEWTDYSRVFSIDGESPATLGQLMTARIAACSPVTEWMERITPLEERYHLLSPGHISHSGCEYRKYKRNRGAWYDSAHTSASVSYTHLTLPTIYSV